MGDEGGALRWAKAVAFELTPVRTKDIRQWSKCLLVNMAIIGQAVVHLFHFIAANALSFCRQSSWLAFLYLSSWCAAFSLAIYFEMGRLFTAASLFTVMMRNLGTRQAGDLSAYSVFNENFERIMGTLNGEQLDAEIRHMPVEELQQQQQQEEGDEEDDQQQLQQIDKAVLKQRKQEFQTKWKVERAERDEQQLVADEVYRQRLMNRRALELSRCRS